MANSPRIALVTGGNKGIGREIAQQLGDAGVHVILGARDPERGKSAVAELASSGISVETLRLDLNDEATIADAAEQIANKHGRLDILVNNASVAEGADAAVVRRDRYCSSDTGNQ